MINVSFYLSAPKAKNFSSLYVSVTSAKERLRFPTGEKLPAQYCNLRKKKGKDLLKKNTAFYLELDKKLNDLRTLFFRIAYDLEARLHRIARPEEIKEEYFARTKAQHQQYDEAVIMPLYIKFIKSGAIVNANSSSSMKFFTALETHLENFQEFRKKKITLSEINLEFWESFKSYFSVELEISNISSNNYLKRLKRFIVYAIDEGYLDVRIPVKKFSYFEELHTDDMALVALDEEELAKFFELDLSTDENEALVRDQFLVECYTGQRYSDLDSVLKNIDLEKDAVTIYQVKTNSRVSIPITEKLRQPIVRLKNRFQQEEIPVLSNLEFNKYLKEIGKKAGMNQQVSVLRLTGKTKSETISAKWELLGSHTGRRTFCTYALSKGIEAELIMRVTGHKTYATFRKYLRLSDKTTQEKFLEKFK
jgi:integrase